MSALPLQRIEGKYEILEKLREGGMGAIYKVRHRLLDEIRVIKLMRPQFVEDQDLKARFLREARLAIKLRHPNIAQLYDFTVDDDDTAFIIMEFIDGVTLEDMLSFHGPPPLGFALEVAQQSLKALGYLHTKGFIHRDISPDNLMLAADPDGLPQVKLIDLGIAKILGTGGESHLTQTGTFLGKIRYAPPEQFGADGASMVDTRGDLYSFGVVLYELLTARFPIQGKDPSSLIAGHLFRPPLPFAETDPQGRLPEALREVVLKALAKTPEERFATAADFSRALAAFRRPSDATEEDLARLLTRPFIRAGVASLADPGSTQDRLDQHFNLVPTPSPGRFLEVVKTEPPPAEEKTSPSPSEAVRIAGGTIEVQLQQGDLSAAESELHRALDTYGDQPQLRTLRDHLEELKLREVNRQVQALLQQARGLLDEGDLEAASDPLSKARALNPRDPEIEDLLDQTEQDLRSREAERTRAREISTAVSAVGAALERQDAQAAEDLLREAESRFGHQEAFPALYAEAAELRRKQLQREAAAFAARARSRAEAQDFQSALDELRQAQRLDPESSEIATLLTEAESGLRRQAEDLRRQAEERLRREKIAETVATVEALLAGGELDAADDILRPALAEHGDEASLNALQSRLEQFRRAARVHSTIESTQRILPVEERQEPAAAVIIEPELIEPELIDPELIDPELIEPELIEPAPEIPEPAPEPEAPAPVAVRQEPLPERAPEPVHPVHRKPRTSPWGLWVAGALTVLALLVIGLIWFRPEPPAQQEKAPAPQRQQEPEPLPSIASPPAPVPTPDEEAAPVQSGWLVIDALPWGEVVRIEDSEGKPVEIGPNRHTPLALSVPEGNYQVVLRGPDSRTEQRVSAAVTAGGPGGSKPVFVVFHRTDAEDYFRDLGF